MKEFCQRTTAWCLTILFFLLPLKFGTFAAMPEQPPMFPTDLLTLGIISWPPHCAGIAGALLLGASVLLFPAPRWRTPGGLTALFWGILLPVATLPGIMGGSNSDYVFATVAHWFGIGAFILSAWWIFSASPGWKKAALNALAAGLLCAGIEGWRQYIWGFDEMQEMIRKQREAGIEISEIMEIRIMDSRVFSTLGSCNTFAGFLLLTVPAVLALVQDWAKRFEPVKISRILFSLVAIFLLIPPFFMTRSRGAWLCAFLTAGIFFFTRKKIKTLYKGVFLVVCLLLLGGGFFLMHRSGRGLLSGVERLDYLRTSLVMCSEHPLRGAGWGEFFHRHMKIKLSKSDESARSPHNLPAFFAVHAGIPAGLVALGALAVLLFELFRRSGSDPVYRWGRWGVAAFVLHCLMEINDVIPASMICCAAGTLALLPEEEGAEEKKICPPLLKWSALAAALLVGAVGFYTNFRWVQSEAAFEKLELCLRPRNIQKPLTAPDPSLVMALLEDVCRLRRSSPYPLEMAGDFFFYSGDTENAVKLYRRSLELVPGRPAAHRRLALAACRAGDRELAKKHLAAARELFPADPKNQEKRFFEEYERSLRK